jgi:hypothetical protein
MATPSSASTTSSKGRRSPESYHSLQIRVRAAEILQSYETLSWFSSSRCEVRMCLFTLVSLPCIPSAFATAQTHLAEHYP